MTVHGFYLSAWCRKCDEEIVYGPCATTIEYRDLPMIPFDMAAQTSFECDNCGATTYTGEFELLTEDEI